MIVEMLRERNCSGWVLIIVVTLLTVLCYTSYDYITLFFICRIRKHIVYSEQTAA